MIGYGILLAIALALNVRDSRMLALCAVVGAGIFFPVPDAYFYLICAMIEALIALLAIRISASASKPVARISMLLIIFHGLGWLLNGFPPESPYHALVKISEHAEILACIILSRYFLKRTNDAI